MFSNESARTEFAELVNRSQPGHLVAVSVINNFSISRIFSVNRGERSLEELRSRLKDLAVQELVLEPGQEVYAFLSEASTEALAASLRELKIDLLENYELSPLELAIGAAPVSADCSESALDLADERLNRSLELSVRLGSEVFWSPEIDLMHLLLSGDDDQSSLAELGCRTAIFLQVIEDIERPSFAAEVLQRWFDADGQELNTGLIISMAERLGICWRLDKISTRLILENKEAIGNLGLGNLFVNLCPSSVRLGDLIDEIRANFAGGQLGGTQIVFELSERSLADLAGETVDGILDLEADGFEFALDDFGTGQASILPLLRLPIRYAKLDKSFLNRDIKAQSLRSVVKMMRELGLDIICEGVETDEHRQQMAAAGVSKMQGWHFGYPEAIADFVRRAS